MHITNNFSSINNINNLSKTNSTNTVKNSQIKPSFKGTENKNQNGLTPEQAAALAAQKLNQKQSIPHVTEKDINFSVTCCGCADIAGNTRKLYDYRCAMQTHNGLDWYKSFNRPQLLRNENGDEKINGETTAVVFPLHPNSKGLRGADNMAMVINGNIPFETINELVAFMAQVGILNEKPIYKTQFYVNSENPRQFMSNPKIKQVIANFFKQKEIEEAQKIQESLNNRQLIASDINIVNIDQKQDKNNTRVVKDYLRSFLKNGKKFTVLHDQIQQNNIQKDVTVILIPSKKSDWDCLTVTIDKKLSEEECKNLMNHLVRNKMANVENENFKPAILEYLNNK